MGGGPTIRHDIDRPLFDEVVLVLRGLFLQSVNKNLEIGLGDAADQLIRRCIVEINHLNAPRMSLVGQLLAVKQRGAICRTSQSLVIARQMVGLVFVESADAAGR